MADLSAILELGEMGQRSAMCRALLGQGSSFGSRGMLSGPSAWVSTQQGPEYRSPIKVHGAL